MYNPDAELMHDFSLVHTELANFAQFACQDHVLQRGSYLWHGHTQIRQHNKLNCERILFGESEPGKDSGNQATGGGDFTVHPTPEHISNGRGSEEAAVPHRFLSQRMQDTPAQKLNGQEPNAGATKQGSGSCPSLVHASLKHSVAERKDHEVCILPRVVYHYGLYDVSAFVFAYLQPCRYTLYQQLFRSAITLKKRQSRLQML